MVRFTVCCTVSNIPTMSQTQEFRETVLNQHNMYREKLSAPRLKLCDNLCNFAQEWANEMRDRYRADKKRNPLAHQSGHDYGENLYQCRSKRNLCGKKVVDSWYNEIATGSKDITKIGHYTQVVWKDSHHLGVGLAIENDMCFVVCNYEPRGNVVGQFMINVPSWTIE